MPSVAANVTRLVDLIRVATRRARGAPAIEFEGETISYGALYGSALRLANGLRGRGFMPGDALGILAGNSPDYLRLYLACQLAGLVAVPLNYRAVADDVVFVLGNCAARGLAFGEAYRPIVEAARRHLAELRADGVIAIGGKEWRSLIDDSGESELVPPSPLAPATI